MPYADHDVRREYDRQRKRAARRGCPTARPSLPPLPADYRLRKAEQVLELLQEQIKALRDDQSISTAERARTIGFLCSTVLRAIEAADLAGRVESLERLLRDGKDQSCTNDWAEVTQRSVQKSGCD